MPLRSTRTFCFITLALIAWGVVSSIIQLCYSTAYLRGKASLNLEDAQRAIGESPYWVIMPLFVVLGAGIAVYLRKKTISLNDCFGRTGLTESLREEPDSSRWLWAALAVFAGAMTVLERISTHYFLQDDNYSQFFPTIQYALKTLYSGYWVSWNPYQLMGTPLTDLGIYALTYPGTHLSYLAARAWGDETRFMDLFVWLHLTVALIGTFYVGRKVRLSSPLAAGVGLCFSLSGYALIGCRSWYYMSPSFAALPVVAFLALTFRTNGRAGWRWTLASGGVLGLLFHAGNAQMWVYTMGFFLFLMSAVIWKKGGALWSMTGAFPALLVVLGIILPLFIPQLLVTQGVYRPPYGEGVFAALPFMILTFPNINGRAPATLIQTYYAGSIFTAVWMLGAASLVVAKGARQTLRQNPLLAVSIVAFLCVIGHQGGLWTIQTLMPVLNRFAFPEKFLPFFHLFSLLVGAMLIERLLSGQRRRDLQRKLVFVSVAVLMLNHVSLSRKAFYDFADAPRYDLPAEQLRVMRPDGNLHRVFPASTERDGDRGFANSLRLSFPTIALVSSVEGYEAMFRDRAQYKEVLARLTSRPLETLRIYGVETVIVHRSAYKDPSPTDAPMESISLVPEVREIRKALAGRTAVYHDQNVDLYHLEEAEPMARPVDLRGLRLKAEIVGNSIRVDTSDFKQGGKVMVNYMLRPGMEARSGNRELPVESDEYGRMVVDVPSGTSAIEVAYRIGWQWPAFAGLICICLGALLERRPAFGSLPVMAVTELLPHNNK